MKLQSPHLADYLKCTPIIDWETPAIIAQTQAITRALTHDTAKAQALFEWVRDAIPHAWDIRNDVVTCTASEVLEQRTGLCYAKSHLLAAMLRCVGIPAGFCYQVFRRHPPYHGLALHGLNGLYLPSLACWVRVDAQGNTGTIDAQFSLTEEQLAFPVDPAQGEFFSETICRSGTGSGDSPAQLYESAGVMAVSASTVCRGCGDMQDGIRAGVHTSCGAEPVAVGQLRETETCHAASISSPIPMW
jgi:transglutaminase-like putative cysteine protease